jgi:8-oxo-dGTP pyrophosphatase MutT (NUDIX family)
MPKAQRPNSGPGPWRQVAALPWRRRGGRLEVCLVTTRETRRWTVPKGWPMKGLSDRRAAAIEAEEEAGVRGKAAPDPLGTYSYWKRGPACFDLVHVAVYPLEVRRGLDEWKERGEREVRWMEISDARIVVDEPELVTLLGRFAEGFEKA